MSARIGAVVPAAGLSSRMDGFKPLLPLGGESLLGRVAATLRAAGVRDILAVAGHRAGEVQAECDRLGVACAVNPAFEQGMFSSVRAGLAALPPNLDAVLILPVDIPLARVQTVRALAAHAGGAPVVYPAFRGRRGHPPRLAAEHVADIAAWGGEDGLGGALRALEARLGADELPVPDAGVLFDLDTPADYREAQERLRRLGRPSPEEVDALLDLAAVSERGLAHARAVAGIARAVAAALNEAAVASLDLELVRSAALLHDIAKGRKNHEAEGGRLLDAAGFPDAARIVAAHRDVRLPGDAPLTEREVVYLADKLVSCDRLVSVARRFQEKLDRFGGDPEARVAISGRRDRALAMLARVERETGRSIGDILARAGLPRPLEAAAAGR